MIKKLFWLLLVFSIILPVSKVQSETSEETYALTVRQLNQEGFAGIDKALKVFEELVRKDPNFLKAYLSAADAYLLKYEFTKKKDKNWLDLAMKLLDTVIQKDPKLFEAYFKRAIIFFNLEQPDRAALDLKKSLEIAPAYLDARVLYLQYLLSSKKPEEAKKFADASLQIFPNNPAPLKSFGDIFFQEGDYGNAVEFYKKVIPLVPQAPFTFLNMGKAYQNLKKYELAIDVYQKALDQNPELVEAHFNLAYCLGEKGELKKAIPHLETYLKKVPKDISALNNLALLYEQTKEPTKARLTWLKIKEYTEDKNYRERAEEHLSRLASSNEKTLKTSSIPVEPPQSGGKKNEKKTK